MKPKCNHLANNIPNNRITRYIVRKLNNKMKDSNSMWRLQIRYRKPKDGCKYGYGGNLVVKGFDWQAYRDGKIKKPSQSDLSKAFSLYLRGR